jgi:hypothetical protein
VLNTAGGTENRNGRLKRRRATPPAEISSVSGATPGVWKEESVVLRRNRFFWVKPVLEFRFCRQNMLESFPDPAA